MISYQTIEINAESRSKNQENMNNLTISCSNFRGKEPEIGKNERERRSFTFSSVQFMNLAHIFGELK